MNHSMALHTDKYQINMMYAHWKNDTHNQHTVFEAFFRKMPFGNGYRRPPNCSGRQDDQG